MTYWFGTTPAPGPTPDTRRCLVRRQGGRLHVVVPAAIADQLLPYDLFLDKAGHVICQGVTRKRVPLSGFGPYRLEKDGIPLDSGPPALDC